MAEINNEVLEQIINLLGSLKEQVASAECSKEEEIEDDNSTYMLTPKGLASIGLVHAGLMESVMDPRFEDFWEMFTEDMKKSGYIKED